METKEILKGRSKHRSTFAVMFYINRTKTKKDGMCQLLCRVTIDTSVAQIGTKIMVDPSVWDGKAGRATGKSKNAVTVNRAIDKLAGEINAHYRELRASLGFVTAELVKNALKGICKKQTTLMKLFQEHNDEFQKRVGVDRVQATLGHYVRTYELLKIFLREKYDTEDVTLRSLSLAFIDAFDLFLRQDRLMAQHTVSGHLINLKKTVRRSVSQGTLIRDPFVTFVPEQPERKCRHLKAEELDRLMNVHIDSKSLRHTRDMFIFSTFTGLAYADLFNLSEEHLKTGVDGSLWIKINRQKTKTECNIRLLEIPCQIIGKYRPERTSRKIFNVKTLAAMCRHFRKIEKMCGIERITFHMARHNFGTHITLSQGVPIETVSRMMGHSSITTTQIYARITNTKVNEDMKNLSGNVNGKYSLYEDELMPVGIRNTDNFRLNDNTVNPFKTGRNYEKGKNRNKK
ncbi:MAG TPA: recombinase [Prolixibacteraceae bacterium]|nr:recombinase [Marinilabiliales bacterium]HBL74322.1 recombinase [Prolixibacteraceae bacterium]HCU64092.1 recombinase [Prolixibacteraceae bacterium]